MKYRKTIDCLEEWVLSRKQRGNQSKPFIVIESLHKKSNLLEQNN